MKFSENWLREWVNPDISSDELSEQLSMAGLEVDDVSPVAGEFSNVVVGHVVECGKHPEADKLQVTKINVGEDELIDIVCGASNCRQGLKVAVAKVGAVLPGNFKIKKAKLRGQPSFGMLCSASEIGLSEESDGILELPEDAVIGQDIRDYLDLDDVSIEVDLTPNRSDCLGIIGIAREVGVLTKTAVSGISIPDIAAQIDDSLPISLAAPAACPRYLGRVIKGININAVSPIWLVEKLRRSGIRSIDPVVDVTNYVLLELGHPMHAFDLAKIEGGITVRYPNENEKLTLLDGTEVSLKKDTLIIADENQPLAMAGIFGGQNSGVTQQTQDVFLEAAFFSRDAILGQARQYGLHTDASHRYERGVDFQLQKTAMERATALLLDIVGGQAGPIVEAIETAQLPQRNDVLVRHARITQLLGTSIPAENITDILNRLGFNEKVTDEGWMVSVPSYRFDVAIEADLIEEVARVYGYNNIPEQAPKASLVMGQSREQQLSLTRVKQSLIHRGYQEAVTYSFVDPKKQSALFPETETLTLPHPISADMSDMRVSLWTGLLQTVSYNQKRQQQRIKLFETGLRFVPDETAEGGVKQDAMLAGVICGPRHAEHWDATDTPLDFYDLKGDVESLLNTLDGADDIRFVAKSHSSLHPGQSAAIYLNDKLLGHIGALHPKFSKVLGLLGKCYLFELELEGLGQLVLPRAEEISKFPANRRDIAIVVDENQQVGEILSFIENIGENQLVGLNLFDVYTGTGVTVGKKSLAISLLLQDVSRTLEDNEIQDVVNNILNKLAEQFDATLRD